MPVTAVHLRDFQPASGMLLFTGPDADGAV